MTVVDCRPFWFLSQFDLCFEVVGSHTLNFRSRFLEPGLNLPVGQLVSIRVQEKGQGLSTSQIAFLARFPVIAWKEEQGIRLLNKL